MYCCRKLVNESLPFQFAERVHFFLFEKLIDAAQMFGYPFVAKLINLADQSVQEVTIVAHEYQCPVEVHKGLFQDVFGLHVQMVGRLIQYQQVHRLQLLRNLGQSRTFAARQDFDFFHGLFRSAKHESA